MSVQRYRCKSCGKTFSGIDGFAGSHFDADVITRSLSLATVKMSSEETRGQLKLVGIKADASTIHRWTDCYSSMMCKYAAVLRIDAGYPSATRTWMVTPGWLSPKSSHPHS